MDLLTQITDDVLHDFLHSTHLRTSLYCQAHLCAPWGLHVPRRDVSVFHVVTQGSCWLRVDGLDAVEAPPTQLGAGDLVILPHGHAHTISDHPATPARDFADFVADHPVDRHGIVTVNGEGPVTTLVCGEFQLEADASAPLLSLLPVCLHTRRTQAASPSWIDAIVDLVKDEAHAAQPGAAAVITRLSEIVFVQAIREEVRRAAAEPGEGAWLAALAHPQVAEALALIHRDPQEPWTLAALARRVGLSRSAFSAKFTALVGTPAMHYLLEMRLSKAATLLRTQSATVRAVARAVGYESDVSLSKAFKRRFGVAPGMYRRGLPPSPPRRQEG